MTDQLTADDLKILQRPFARADHEFTRGYVYISEEAITNRLEELDPDWQLSEPQIHYMNNQAIATATLTVKGVSRGGVGMGALVNVARDGKETPGADPAKSAATDALKRAARLFGIGRYLLNAPQEGRAFDEWLAKLQNAAGIAPQRATTNGNGGQATTTPDPHIKAMGEAWPMVADLYSEYKNVNDGKRTFMADVEILERENKLPTGCTDAKQISTAVHHDLMTPARGKKAG